MKMPNLPQGIKSLGSAPAPSAQRSRSAKSSSLTSDASVFASAAMAIAAKMEAASNTKMFLESAAMEFYQSNFDKTRLPADPTIRAAIQMLAKKMQECEQAEYGEFYAAPGVIDITQLPALKDASVFDAQSMALSFFGPSTQPRQIAGGN
jgi:hypothetical protein